MVGRTGQLVRFEHVEESQVAAEERRHRLAVFVVGEDESAEGAGVEQDVVVETPAGGGGRILEDAALGQAEQTAQRLGAEPAAGLEHQQLEHERLEVVRGDGPLAPLQVDQRLRDVLEVGGDQVRDRVQQAVLQQAAVGLHLFGHEPAGDQAQQAQTVGLGFLQVVSFERGEQLLRAVYDFFEEVRVFQQAHDLSDLSALRGRVCQPVDLQRVEQQQLQAELVVFVLVEPAELLADALQSHLDSRLRVQYHEVALLLHFACQEVVVVYGEASLHSRTLQQAFQVSDDFLRLRVFGRLESDLGFYFAEDQHPERDQVFGFSFVLPDLEDLGHVQSG